MKKVLIGISGGVDSSVAALLLKEKGYEVIGVTFIFTDDFDTTDAKTVCEKLNIQHLIKDYRKEFKEQIIDKFILDYKKTGYISIVAAARKLAELMYTLLKNGTSYEKRASASVKQLAAEALATAVNYWNQELHGIDKYHRSLA